MTSGFVDRHVGTDATDQRRMLAAVDPGLASLDALVDQRYARLRGYGAYA